MVLLVFAAFAFCFTGCKEKGMPAEKNSQAARLDVGTGFVGREYVKMDSETMPGKLFYYSGACVWSVQNSFFYKGAQVNEEMLSVAAEEYRQIEIKSTVWRQEAGGQAAQEPACFAEINGYAMEAISDGQGDVWLLLMSTETYLGFEEQYFLVKFDRDGNERYRVSLEDCPGMLAVDGEGNAAIQTVGGVLFFDSGGRKRGTTKSSEMILSLCGDAEKGFYLIETGVGGTDLVRKTGDKEELLKLDCADLIGVAPAGFGNVLVWNSMNLYAYSLDGNTLTKLCSWAEVGIYSGDIENCLMDEECRIHLITGETTGNYLITLEQAREEEQTKQLLTLGTWKPTKDLMIKAAAFNRANERYAITIVDYSEGVDGRSSTKEVFDAKERMKLDLLSGKGPDLVVVSPEVDLEALAGSGVVVDLNPYLERSSKISREDFFEEVLLSATRGDLLTYLPENFGIYTIVGNADVLEGMTEWTVEDMIKLAENRTDAYLYAPNYLGKDVDWASTILQTVFERNPKLLLEEDGMELSTWCALLELAKKEYDNTRKLSLDDWPESFRDGSILAQKLNIVSFKDLQTCKRFSFGNKQIRVIGYPTVSGGSGHVLYPIQGIAMLHSCKDKEGAFQFLELYVSNWNEELQAGFPAIREIFDEQLEKSLAYSETIPPEGMHNDYVKEDLILMEEIIHDGVGDYVLAEKTILKMMNEEVQEFYHGNKSAQEVIDKLRRRVRLYVSESDS